MRQTLSFLSRAALPLAVPLLAALALANLAQGVYFALQYSQDFQWSPAVLLSEGADPYRHYLAGNADGRIILSQEPNYLPLLYLLLLPTSYLSWDAVKLVWALCNVGMAVAAAILLAGEAGLQGRVKAAAAATFLASSPVSHSIGNGQQSLLALLALTLAWTWRGRAGGGLALAVAAVKYSFAPPFGAWLLAEKRGAALGVAAVVTGLAMLAFMALSGASAADALTEPFRVSAEATHVGVADVMSLARALHLDQRIAPGISYALGFLVMAIGLGLVARMRRRLDDLALFSLIAVVSLVSFFHNLYDYVLLAPLFFRALSFAPRPRVYTLVYIFCFWFGVRIVETVASLKYPLAIAAMTLLSALAFALAARASAQVPLWTAANRPPLAASVRA